MDIQELARHALKYFETFVRPDEKERQWTLKARRPTWLREMMFKVHDKGEMLPDDFRYETVVTVLNLLEEGMDPEQPELEPDVYTHDLLKWLQSHSWRPNFVDDAVGDFGHSKQGILGDIAYGQIREKEEIFHKVVDALNGRLEKIEEGIKEKFETQGEPDPEGPLDWTPR